MKIRNTDSGPIHSPAVSPAGLKTHLDATVLPATHRSELSDPYSARMMKIYKEGGGNVVAYTTTVTTVTTITLKNDTEDKPSSSDLIASTPEPDHQHQAASSRLGPGASGRGSNGVEILAKTTADACEFFEVGDSISRAFEHHRAQAGELPESEIGLNEVDEEGVTQPGEAAEGVGFIEILEFGLLAPRLAATVYNWVGAQRETKAAYGEWKESRQQTLDTENKILGELRRSGVPEERLKELEANFAEVRKLENFTTVMPIIEKSVQTILKCTAGEGDVHRSDGMDPRSIEKDVMSFLAIQYSKCALNERVKVFNFLASCMETAASSAEVTGSVLHFGDSTFDVLGEVIPGMIVANAAFSIAKGCFAIASEQQYYSLLQKERAFLRQGSSNEVGDVPVDLVQLKSLEIHISKLRIGREGTEVFGHVLRSAGKITSMAGAPQVGEVINGVGRTIATGANIAGYFLNRKANIAMGSNPSSAQLRFEANREKPIEKIELKGLDKTVAFWEQKYRETEDNVASIKALSVIQKVCEKEASGKVSLTPEEREKEVEKVRMNLNHPKTFLFGDTTLTGAELNRVREKLAALDREFYTGTHIEVLSKAKELFGGEHLDRLNRSLSFIDRVSHDARKEYNKLRVRLMRGVGLSDKNPVFSDRYKEKMFINFAKTDAKHMRNTIGVETQDLITAKHTRDKN